MNYIQKISGRIAQSFSTTPVEQKRKGNIPIARVQLQRIRQDILSWRESQGEAENAWYPQRVKMQRMYIDTRLNGHVISCMEKRYDLTLLRGFDFVDANNKPLEEVTKLFDKEWFFEFLTYTLDAIFHGYSLINLGDIENDEFTNLSNVRRWNISPDRRNVPRYVYGISGASWEDPEYVNWNVYVDTPNSIGTSPCGYGLLYVVALYEILCRNNIASNADSNQLFAQPYRVGRTDKTNESERAELEAALRDMGSSGYAILDPQDSIEFLETALGSNGYIAYDNLEMRCEKKISKIILGHADAIDSVPGKLGSGNEDSPAEVSMAAKQTSDGRFCENVIMKLLLPKMRKLGFIIPEGVIKFKNDKEAVETRKAEDGNNKITAEIAQTMKNAGLKMDAKYFTDRTGIPAEEIAEPAPIEEPFSTETAKKLKDLYS